MAVSPHLVVKDAAVEFEFYNSELRTLKKIFKNISKKAVKNEHLNGKLNENTVTALKNININLKSGDKLGLIGANGAGKTTLLKMLAGIYFPSFGKVERSGLVSAIFTLGLGIDPNASGLDNIYLSLLLAGIPRSAIDDLLDDIISFSELGDFIYLPVRTYSDGMKVRLSFAIGTSIVPDILIIDEVLGAGDKNFTRSLWREWRFFSKKQEY